MIKCALFDLDGTLVNTSIDLGRAADYVLRQKGVISKWTEKDYLSFVGNGARVLLDKAFEHTLNDKELDDALELFKTKYNEILIDNAYIYDGMLDVLNEMKAMGIKLAVVTNKPHSSAVLMVERLFGKDYFDYIIGAFEDKPKKPDPYSANMALEKLDCKPAEAIFVGDSDIDVYTAQNAGIEAVACSWGFRSFACLLSVSPSVIIDSPEYILKLF
ncbi:MAG: HAD-IIIA family hydrolase [Clostridium sp.]|nr:HAD-IIIA family hydrolase [Clostridium sp.]